MTSTSRSCAPCLSCLCNCKYESTIVAQSTKLLIKHKCKPWIVTERGRDRRHRRDLLQQTAEVADTPID